MPRHSFCWITPALATPIVNTSNDLKMSDDDLNGFERYHEPLSTPPCILFLNGFPKPSQPNSNTTIHLIAS
jgi:hypothetical protein